MKVMRRLIALIAVLSLFAALCGCGKAAEPASSAPASEPESNSGFWVDPSYTVDAEGELPEVPDGFLRKAMEAYSWFELNLLGWIYDVPAKHTENAYLVEDEQFRRYDDFRDYLLGIFSPAIVNELLSRGYYVEEDGYLYTRHFPRGADKAVIDTDFGEGEIVGRKLIYKVDVTFGDMQTLEPIRSETFTFVAEPVNGRFVFTEFPYFY
ncbi:MAG: hypothetical protein J5441_00010 [Clostridia bacterium]|nr:hypothetical protein [Clostridia bacterium]